MTERGHQKATELGRNNQVITQWQELEDPFRKVEREKEGSQGTMGYQNIIGESHMELLGSYERKYE